MHTIHRLATAVGLSMLAAAAFSAQSQHACAVVKDPTDRLACYDAAFGHPQAQAPEASAAAPKPTPMPAPAPASDPTPPPAAGSPAATEPAAPDAENFGFTEAQRRARSSESSREPDQIEATVARVDRRPTGAVFQLDNGQAWVQVDSRYRDRISAGEHITVRRAAMGSYLLSNGQIAVRVRRME